MNPNLKYFPYPIKIPNEIAIFETKRSYYGIFCFDIIHLTLPVSSKNFAPKCFLCNALQIDKIIL